jgi:hypothetical protein
MEMISQVLVEPNDLIRYKANDPNKSDDACGDFEGNTVLHNDVFSGSNKCFTLIKRYLVEKAPSGMQIFDNQ